MLRTMIFNWRNIPNTPEEKPKEKVSAFTDRYTYGQKLRNKGFLYLGSGAYSTVYGHPSSQRVIKVTAGDPGWWQYVQWAEQKGYAGTWAPKVYRHKDHRTFHVFVMERMKEGFFQVASNSDLKPLSELTRLHGEHRNQTAGLLSDLLVPGISVFTDNLREEFDGHLDMHDGNIMLRENGTVCFTDPVAISKTFS